MDAPHAVSIHKENVHVGRGKAAAIVKPVKLKPAKNKERKALADLKYIHDSTAGASKDAHLKQKSGREGNEVERNPMTHAKQHEKVTGHCATNKPVFAGIAKGANLSNKSEFLGNLGKGNTPLGHILTDEEIKQCYEWAKDGIEEMGGYSWSAKDESDLFMNQFFSETMAFGNGEPISESDEEGYETDGSDWDIYPSFPGHLASKYTPEELEDPLGVAGIVLDEYPLPKLELNEGHEDVDIVHDNDNHCINYYSLKTYCVICMVVLFYIKIKETCHIPSRTSLALF